MFELKKYRGVIFYETGQWCKIWRGMYLPVQNWHEEFKRILTVHSKISKMCPLMGCLWPKYIMFELGVIFDGTKDWSNIWRKAELRFQKWHDKFGKFSPENLKALKLRLWWNLFIQSRKCMSLKFTDELLQ